MLLSNIMKFFIKTFGCRTNIAESEELAEKLKENFCLAKNPQTADFIIIRSCAVTAGAEAGVRRAISKFKRMGKKIFILGCYLAKKIPTDSFFRSDAELLKFLKKQFPGQKNNEKEQYPLSRVRAFIKIQSGCDFDCAFCVTKILRGKSKTEPEKNIIGRVRTAKLSGAKEIVLTGTNILLYKNLPGLIKKILHQTTIPRIRFGSIDPRLVTDEFIVMFKNPRLMPHLHLSIQSGSPDVLKSMHRPIDIKKIEQITKKLRQINPLFNFSADIIVGYPTETENDFKKTLELAKKLQLSKIHYFPYSARPKTPAEKLKEHRTQTISARLAKIKKLDEALQTAAKKRLAGKKLTILFEYNKNNLYYGYAPNFIRIKKASGKNLTNKLADIIIKNTNL